MAFVFICSIIMVVIDIHVFVFYIRPYVLIRESSYLVKFFTSYSSVCSGFELNLTERNGLVVASKASESL